jgi:7,8-dihydropterin-6-yl-methyl-4-(beta-D-ribofuranosyl)aminobenzene 5'-phosphate synthase
MQKNRLKGTILFLTIPILVVSIFIIGSQNIAAAPNSQDKDLYVTIVYDNNAFDKNLETRWGFSCYIKCPDKTILFDVGGEGSVLLKNMERLKIDPKTVEIIILSHIHSDHIGGLSAFLAVNSNVVVFLPDSLPLTIKNLVNRAGAQLVEVRNTIKICKDVYSTGELGSGLKEQSLIIKTAKGLVVITGCAHPGIVNIIKEAKEILKSDVYLVLGGFHLVGMSRDQIAGVVDRVKDQGVKKVAPCHCSGDLAREHFAEVYGDDFILAGAGKTIIIKDAFSY